MQHIAEALEARRLLAAGGLDPFFGDGGRAITPLSDGYIHAMDFVVQRSGRMIVAGNSFHRGTGDAEDRFGFALVHYTADGKLDPRFGTGGIVETSAAIFDNDSEPLQLQPDGSLLIAHLDQLQRIAADGTPDPSFGTRGVVAINGGPQTRIDSILGLSGGKVLVTGSFLDARDNLELFIVRLNADGTPDKSFGTNGRVQYDFYPDDPEQTRAVLESHASRAAIDPRDGSIVLGGSWSSTIQTFDDIIADGRLLVARFSASGKFIGKREFTADASESGRVRDVRITPDGKILALTDQNARVVMRLYRLNRDLSLDASFDRDGQVARGYTLTIDARSVLQQSDGKIIVALSARDEGQSATTLLRYNADGSPDNSFDGDGVRSDFQAGKDSHVVAAALAPDGTIVAGGYFSPGNGDQQILIERIWRDNAPAATAHIAPLVAGWTRTQKIIVTYRSDQVIDIETFGNHDLRVTGPNNYVAYAKVAYFDINTARERTAVIYKLGTPGGGWRAGSYSVRLRAHQIADAGEDFAVARNIGTFSVTQTVSRPSHLGAPLSTDLKHRDHLIQQPTEELL